MARCPSCTQENRPGARFCDNCGSSLAEVAAPREYAPPEGLARKIRASRPLEGERKQVTVLFADVSGSMDLAESVDAEQWRRIMDRFFTLLCDGVHRFEGTVVQFTGDGVMALFGAPIAHEDHAQRAAHAALRLARDLSEHAAELRREEGLNFSVRLGLNSGEVVVGAIGEDLRVDFTAIGHTVGLAKRMESLAEPGRAYVTEHTAALLDGYFELRDLGPFDVKGVREPVRVSELAGLGRARTRLDIARARGFSRFVGRVRELETLEAALEDALAGNGRVVGIVGEAGVGKSRLSHEFAELARARGVPVFSASGQAHARAVPFHAALEMMRGYFGLQDDDPPQVARERIAGRLLLLDPDFAPKLPLVFDFLGVPDPERPAPRMDPDARQRMLLAGAREMLQAHAAREAAVNVFEDLHWVDDASLAFLHAVIDAVPGHRSLVVVNFRPEFRAPWMDRPEYSQIELVPLGVEAVRELTADLLGRHASLDGLAEEILERTGGNPFFVEELVQTLVEDGTLVGERGARRLAKPLGQIAVPPSVHGVLAARIDRLPDTCKQLLQFASVAGREVHEPLLERVSGYDDLHEPLANLVENGFLVDHDEDTFAFRHALTQEVAYGSLLAESRRRAHGALARGMIELYSDRLDERAALIAGHFEAAGKALDAVRWHARAAAWAGTSDAVQASEHWQAVRRLCAELESSPETDGLALAACMWTMQFSWRLGIADDEVDAVYEAGKVLAERLGDDALSALLTTSWAGVVGISRNMALAVQAAEKAADMVRGLQRPDVEVPVLVFLSYSLLISGRYPEGLATVQRGIELTAADRSLGAGIVVADPHGWFHMMRGFLAMVSGRLDEARADVSRAIELCSASGDLETTGWALMVRGLLRYFTGLPEDADESTLRSVQIADTIGSPFSRIWARYNLGLAHMTTGRLEEAAAMLEETIAMIQAAGTGRECEPWTLAVLGMVQADSGDADAALRTSQRALELVERRGVRNARPNALCALGLAQAAQGDIDAAATTLDAALEDARAIGAASVVPLVELRIADVAALHGDDAARERALTSALAGFERVGARGYVEALQEWASATPR